jgi:hypothetical protein
MSSLADHQARQARAMAMAERCSEANNPAAAAEWLAEAIRQGEIIKAMQAHPAGRAR